MSTVPVCIYYFYLWAMLVAGQPTIKIDSIVCQLVEDTAAMRRQASATGPYRTDIAFLMNVCDTFPKPLKIDSCYVLPHDTVVCRFKPRPFPKRGYDSTGRDEVAYGDSIYRVVCDTIRVGNHWLYRTIRGKDTSAWRQHK